nr:restriction endonuclease subunit S [Bifidobacterium longum]
MMTEQEKVPAIRFAGFTDPWEQRKLGDIAERVTRKNENNESDLPLTISAQHGLIDQRLFFNAQVASRDMSGYYLLRQGEFAYNKSTSADSPWGAIKRLTRYEKGCVSTLYICFALLNANPDYLVTYYETNRWHKAVQMIAAEGARNHGLLNIAPDDFFDTMVSLPESQAEQQTIGAFFSRLDSLITLHQRKYDKLVIFKKSMLEKMFPKDGESVPEIRFAGFTDPWEQRKLGELSSEFQSGDFISAEEILGSGPYPVYGGNGLRGYAKQYNHDGFYALIGRQGALCGNVNTAVGKAYFTEHAVAVKANFLHDTRFLAHLLGCMDLGRYSGQSAQPGLAVGVLKEVETTVPSKAEQQAIGSFFSRLDSLITLHQRKLELLQNIKKSLLDKMFV